MALTGIKWNDTARHLIGCEPLKDFYKIRIENAGTLIECKFVSINETHRRYIVDVITNMFRDDMTSKTFFANITHDNAEKWRVSDMVNYIKNERGDK